MTWAFPVSRALPDKGRESNRPAISADDQLAHLYRLSAFPAFLILSRN